MMKIKKFVAPDIRRAIKMVRDEQGPDAVIISNKRVDGGVENQGFMKPAKATSPAWR